MAYGNPEQIESKMDFRAGRTAYKRYLKKVAAKRFRLLWKKRFEDAPKKMDYKGWEY